MLKTDFKIAAIIAKYLAGDMTQHEQTMLDDWKNESEHNKQLFDRLIHPLNLQQLEQMAARYNTDTGWRGFLRKQQARKRRLFLYRAGYAALFLVLLSVSYLYIIHKKGASVAFVPQPAMSELIIPGGTKATLTLADGATVILDECDDYKLEESRETDSVSEEYHSAAALVYHKIETPRGGEYAFTLGDGTTVRLNAASTIHFPIDFGDVPRVVELEGEAFFEVKSTGQPFIIKTRDMLIEVMGTSFNVSSYADETCSSVTLVNGSVKVEAHHHDSSFVLTSSEQVLFDRNTGNFSVRQVDISSYIAWNNGMFYFKDWTLEEIMHYLSRWYDIDEVIYKDEHLKTAVFGCKFSKYDDISQFLQAFERTGKAHYSIEGKTIIFANP